MSQNRFLSPDSCNIVEVSTDDELSKMLGAERNGVSSICHPRTPEIHCPICLEKLTNRCSTNVCVHMFCFECLKRWASINRSCPLCKKEFRSIKHSLSEYGHKEYEVPSTSSNRIRCLFSMFNNIDTSITSTYQFIMNFLRQESINAMEAVNAMLNHHSTVRPLEINGLDSRSSIIDFVPTSGNDSNLEMIDSFTPTNAANPSKDLPSTSTGIQDSLDRPNNKRMIVNSSSSDDDIEPGITAVARRRKRKIRKMKPRKKKNC